MNNNEAFYNYLKEFKKLSTMEKRKELITNLKEFIAIFDVLATKENISLDYYKSNEINDLKNNDVSEDDFLEALFVYFEVSKSILGQYLCHHDHHE